MPKGWEDLIQNVKSVSITAWRNSEHLQSISLERECEHRSLQRNASRLQCLFASRPSPIFLMERGVFVLFFIPLLPPPDSVSLCIWMPQTICTSLLFCPFRSAQATCLLFSIHGFASTLLAECHRFFLKGSWSAQLLVFCVARVTWSDRSSWLASCWIANLLGILSEANKK